MLASPTWLATSKISSNALASVSSSCEIVASASTPAVFREDSFATLSLPSTSLTNSSLNRNCSRPQESAPLMTTYTDSDGNEQQPVNDGSGHQEPPTKRLKTTPKKAKSVSPKKRRPLPMVHSRLTTGMTSPDRVRSPSARSRSTTEFGSLEGTIPRLCCTSHDGGFGEELTTADTVVKRLMKSYKACKHNYV